MIPIINNNAENVESFLKLDGKPYETCLFDAINYSNPQMIALLIKYDANVNALSPDYRFTTWTCLHEAAQNGRAEIVDLLLKNGANPKIKFDNRSTARDVALYECHRNSGGFNYSMYKKCESIAEMLKQAEDKIDAGLTLRAPVLKLFKGSEGHLTAMPAVQASGVELKLIVG